MRPKRINKEISILTISLTSLCLVVYFTFVIIDFNHKRLALFILQNQAHNSSASLVSGSQFVTSASSTIYYIDSSLGDDKYDGKSQSVTSSSTGPWKTLSKMTTRSFSSGDQILLNCEGVWRERLELKSNFAPSGMVKIGAYGNCNNNYPRITGTDVVSGPWVNDSSNSNIVVAPLDKEPLIVFINGIRQDRARYPNYVSPNDSYNLTKIVNSNSSVVLSDVDKSFLADKDMVGAGFYIRVEPWWVHSTTVQSYDASTATLIPDKEMPYTVEPGNGYILEGKKWMIDKEGEWYYDSVEKKLYIYKPSSVSMQNVNVEASVRWNSIYLNGASNVELNHIRMGESRDKSLATLNVSNVNIEDVIVRDDLTRNVEIMSSSNVSINNSKFGGAGYVGVDIGAGANNSITSSTVTGHGLGSYPGPVQGAISVNSDNVLVENNRIENSGYHGISFNNRTGTRIIKNVIKNICIKLSDCGGIYTYNGSKLFNPLAGALIENNSIVNAQVNSHGSSVSFAGGVYLDNFTNNVTVSNNFISDVSSGIFLHEASDNEILNNKVWKTTRYALGAGAASGDQYRNVISGNTFFATKYYTKSTAGAPAPVISFASKWGNALPLSEILDKNTIANNVIVTFNNIKEKLFEYNDARFDTGEWNVNGRSGTLMNSLESDLLKVSTSGPNIISNGDMSGPLWSVYFENKTLGEYATSSSNSLCDGVCAKFKPGMGGDILVSNKFNLNSSKPNNLYYLRAEFTAGDTDTGGHVTVRRDATPYDNFGYSKALPTIKAGTKYVLEEVFAATNSDKAMLNIYGKVGTSLYVDNVSLYKVDSVNYFDPYKYSYHLINDSESARAYTCAETGIISCDAYSDDGSKINWPITLPSRSSRIIMSDTGMWRAQHKESGAEYNNPLPVLIPTSTMLTSTQSVVSTTTQQATTSITATPTSQVPNSNNIATVTLNYISPNTNTSASKSATQVINTITAVNNQLAPNSNPSQNMPNIKGDSNKAFSSERVLMVRSGPESFSVNLNAEEAGNVVSISKLNIIDLVSRYFTGFKKLFKRSNSNQVSAATSPQALGTTFDDATTNIKGEIGNFVISHKVSSGDLYSKHGEIDLGYLNNHEAGSKGQVYIDNGHLYLAGERIRFYGINLFCGATIPTNSDAEAMAKRLKSEGFNAVRLGCFLRKLDSNPNPGTPPLASYRQQGILNQDNETFNDKALDQFDYFINQLQENGIYIQFMLTDSYNATAGYEDCLDSCRGVNMYLSGLMDSQKDMAYKFLSHKNPYSNRYYYNDPGVLAIDYNNENSIMTVWVQKTLDKYSDNQELKQKYIQKLENNWNQWLTLRYGAISDIGLKHGKAYNASSTITIPLHKNIESMNESEFRDWIEFLSEVELAYKIEMTNYLKKDIKVTSIIYSTQNNYDRNFNRSVDDVSDIHTYFGDLGTPTGEVNANGHPVLSVQNKSILNVGTSIQSINIPGIFENKEYGKPAFISETAYRAGNQYLGEFEPILSAYAAFNDIDAFYIFSYKDNNLYNLNTVTAPWYNSTINSLTRPSAVLSFRNGYIAAGIPSVVSKSKGAYLDALTNFTSTKSKWVTSVSNFHFGGNIRSQYTNNMYFKSVEEGQQEGIVTINNMNDEGAYLSTSKEISLKLGEYFKINNNKIKSVIGFLDNKIVDISDFVRVEIGDTLNDYAIFSLVSLDKNDIISSDKILLTLGGYYEVEGEWPRSPGSNKYSLGTGSQKIEIIPASINLRLNKKHKVYALDSAGNKIREIETSYTNNELSFRVGPTNGSGWYSIESDVEMPVELSENVNVSINNSSTPTSMRIHTSSTSSPVSAPIIVKVINIENSRPAYTGVATDTAPSAYNTSGIATSLQKDQVGFNTRPSNPTFRSERVLLIQKSPETFTVIGINNNNVLDTDIANKSSVSISKTISSIIKTIIVKISDLFKKGYNKDVEVKSGAFDNLEDARVNYYIDPVMGLPLSDGLNPDLPAQDLKQIKEFNNIIINIKEGSSLIFDKSLYLNNSDIRVYGGIGGTANFKNTSTTTASIIAVSGKVNISNISIIGGDMTKISSPAISVLDKAVLFMDNVEIKDYANGVVVAGSNSIISNSRFSDISNNAINVGDRKYVAPSNIIIENNYINIAGANNDAITLHDGTGEGMSNTIRSNHIYGKNRENAIDVLGQYGGTLIENNVISDSGTYAITISAGNYLSTNQTVIKGNTFSNLAKAAIYSRSKNILIESNHFNNLTSNSLATAIAVANSAIIRNNEISINEYTSRPVMSFLEEQNGGSYGVEIKNNKINNNSSQMIFWYNGSTRQEFLENFVSENNNYLKVGTNMSPFLNLSADEWMSKYEILTPVPVTDPNPIAQNTYNNVAATTGQQTVYASNTPSSYVINSLPDEIVVVSNPYSSNELVVNKNTNNNLTQAPPVIKKIEIQTKTQSTNLDLTPIAIKNMPNTQEKFLLFHGNEDIFDIQFVNMVQNENLPKENIVDIKSTWTKIYSNISNYIKSLFRIKIN